MKNNISNFFITAIVVLTIFSLITVGIYNIINFLFLSKPGLITGLILIGLGVIAALVCVVIIQFSGIIKSNLLIKKSLDSLKDINKPPKNFFDLFTSNPSSTFTFNVKEESKDISNIDKTELESMLRDALLNEDYDTAAKIRDELSKRK